MSGEVLRQTTPTPHVERVLLRHAGKHNAVSVDMWRALGAVFEALQAQPPAQAPRAVIVCGDGGHFAAGGDIEEFPQFRFDAERLQHFHDDIVAPALQAMLDCDIPLVAQIRGSCIGGGLEIAACCDLRIAGAGARFGAPIGKLGFPMAPGELRVLSRVVPMAVLREVLLEGRLFDADGALQRGLVQRVVADAELAAEAMDSAQRIAVMSPQAARINKRTMRQLSAGGPTAAEHAAHFSYAADAEHREGIAAFLAKRPAVF
jgi:enoyl-CoA hydratase/carnithine racemase